MRSLIGAICVLGMLVACITPIDQELGEPKRLIVIEGFIDDGFGPHEIKVSSISKFASAADGGGIRRLDASVTVFDDLGNSFQATRETVINESLINLGHPAAGSFLCIHGLSTSEGTTNYMTSSDFRGVPGRSYSLEVVLDDGIVCRSEFQKL